MTYSEEWNDIYARGEQTVRWPWSDLVSAVKRHCGDISGWDVLELGCGPTAPNGQFFGKENAQYFGIDAADHPSLDFTKQIPKGPFDLIVDRAAVTHNDTESIKRCLDLAYEALKPGGWYIGVDWFSMEHSDSKLGDAVDEWTYTDAGQGQFVDCGNVHFSDEQHIRGLFKDFDIISLDHKVVTSLNSGKFASFNIVARKE